MYGLKVLTFIMVSYVAGDFIGIHPLILGGKTARIEDAPFMALYTSISRTLTKQSLCGASVISEKFVLSAAHCYVTPKFNYFVLVGSDIRGNGRAIKIAKTIIHPYYNDKNEDYDVLVLKLREKLEFNDKIQPIKMADPDLTIPEGAILETFGFGRTEYDGYLSHYLLKARLPYVDQNTCSTFYGTLTSRMMCAGSVGTGNACKGDSGGPLIYGNVLVGVVSFGNIVCGRNGVPEVYTRVSSVRYFIDDAMKSY